MSRPRTAFALLLLIVEVGIAKPVLAVPIVANAGLEEGGAGPSHWRWASGEGGRGDFRWETGLAHSGSRSFRVVKYGASGYTTLVSEPVAVEPGKTYHITAWVYPNKRLRGGVYFMISQHRPDSDDQQLPNTFGRTDQPLLARQWQQLSVRVEVCEGNTRLRIHCIQAFNPSDVCWDDFEVTEAGTEPPPRYEPPTKERLPDLEPAREIVHKRPRARAALEVREERPRLIVDGKSVPWAFYVSPFWNPQDAQVADFRDAGVRVYLVPLVLGWQVYADRGPWRGPGQYDFSEVDDLLWRVLRVDPEGYILFYMACDPYHDYGTENPDHVTWDQEGRKAIVHMHPKRWGDDPKPPERFGPSPLSPKVRDDIAATLRKLVAHVEASEPGRAVIGYHVAGFNDGQWFHWECTAADDPHLADYSPGAQEGFRAWLRRVYGGSRDALARAWNRPDANFDTARAPDFARYWTEDFLVDPATQQDVADWTRFYSEGVAETVDYLASVLKQATPRPIICGTYYEDITCNSPNHIALATHLASTGIDYLAGPAAYSIRMPGYPGAVRSVFGSTLLHGKTYLTEQDWRSWHSSPNSPEDNFAWGRAETAEAHNAMVRRECGMMLAFGLGTWWYDMGGGWFRDDQIMAAIREALEAFGRDLQVSGLPRADLAVVVSEESNAYLFPRMAATVRWRFILRQIEELNTSGVPYRLYLQSDLDGGRLPDHKAYLFLNPYYLTPGQRRAVEELKGDGKLLAFVHAPGVVGAEDPSAAIGEITGLKVTSLGLVDRLAADPTDAAHPLLRDLDGVLNMGGAVKAPAFAVVGPDATALARYVGTDSVAVAARDFGSWKSVFVGAPGFTEQFAHNLARWAGCWCVAQPGDAVYANDRFLTVHAIFPGRKALHLRRPSRVLDLTSGEEVAASTDRVEVDMNRGETRWFFLTPL